MICSLEVVGLGRGSIGYFHCPGPPVLRTTHQTKFTLSWETYSLPAEEIVSLQGFLKACREIEMSTFHDCHTGLHFWFKELDPTFEHMRQNGIFEAAIIKECQNFLTQQGTFVDIGAHIGTYALTLSRHCQQVHAFECQKDTYQGLLTGIEANHCTNVTPHLMALGANNVTEMTYYQNANDGGTTTLDLDIAHQTGTRQVLQQDVTTMRTLDSFHLEGVDLIKIDVEGFEAQVILGALKTLEANHYPTILFEAWSDEWYRLRKEMLLGMLRGLGYQVVPVNGHSQLFWAKDHPKRQAYLESIAPLWEQEYLQARKLRIAGQRHEAYQHVIKGFESLPASLVGSLIWARLKEEVGILAFYLGSPIKEQGLASCEEVVLSRLPWPSRNLTLFNQGFYMSPLPMKKHHRLEFEMPDQFKPSSPSIRATKDGYVVNIRMVNYTIGEKGRYLIRDPQNIVHTKNRIFPLDHNFQLKTDDLVVHLNNASDHPMHAATCMGFEDLRLFDDNKFFATTLMTNAHSVPEVSYGSFDRSGLIRQVVSLRVAEKLQCEKNWLPWLVDDQTIRFIYSWQPFRLFEIKIEGDGKLSNLHEVLNTTLSERHLDTFRGSAPPIPYTYHGRAGRLMTIHQVHYNSPRKYYHRLVWLSDRLLNWRSETKTLEQPFLGEEDFVYSPPFFFHEMGIEFNLSICVTPHQEVVFGYSVMDNSANLAIVDFETIDRYLDSGTRHHTYQ